MEKLVHAVLDKYKYNIHCVYSISINCFQMSRAVQLWQHKHYLFNPIFYNCYTFLEFVYVYSISIISIDLFC